MSSSALGNVHVPSTAGYLVTVASIQMEPRIGCKEENLARSVTLVERAAAGGATLVVLPELTNTGYVFESRAEAFALAEPVPDGPSTVAWMEVARRCNT
jgi:N-carbamoylputrescine amidase